MIRTLLLAASASIAFTGCAMMNADAGAGADARAGMANPTPTQARAYVELAASSDMFEIQSSRIALERSQNAQVRQFAQMMIEHHGQTSQQLMAAARASNIAVPTQMMPMHAQLVAALRASGSIGALDRLYVQQQITAHQQALALHGNYAARGDTPALRQVASAATPIVRQHLEQAQRLPR